MDRIDAHCHIPADHADSVGFLAALEVRPLNIAFGTDDAGKWRGEGVWGAGGFVRAAAGWPDRCFWCTGFDLPRFDDPGWADSVIAALDEDFKLGAVAVKVWKNFGMQVRKPSGEWMLVDDPLLEPVFAHLEKTGRTLIAHIGDPRRLWEAGQEGEFAMHGKEGAPSYERVMGARDRVLERHPRLRVVGCHLGSIAPGLKEIAARLDRYSNFALDTSARLKDLAAFDRGEVREFFAKYRTRLLFGTDLFTEKPHSALSEWERTKELGWLRYRYLEMFGFYESGDEMLIQDWALTPFRVRGLGLPADFYRGNALRWIPALAGKMGT